jgi:GMP reductase
VAHVKRVRASHPGATLIAGNVVTGEMTEELILSGADIVKVNLTAAVLAIGLSNECI